ncbi:hypothetical protein GCK32_009638 [Trichostrongylus colubriformis]|uniref:Uncharacterized protein n=1 Tax=Trichostrongylus colubriformis TaxID=6319 RepID=A0AAN8FS75_TRICO
MAQCYHIVILLSFSTYVGGQGPVKIDQKKEVDRASDVYPYTMPTLLGEEKVLWEEGYINEFPAYAIAYEPLLSDTYFYIFPPRDCAA